MVVGRYVLDLLVENKLVIELKACDALGAAHKAQTLNELRVTRKPLALLLNFGRERLEYQRVANRHAR